MEQNNTILPAEVLEQIDKEAEAYAEVTGDRLTNIYEYYTHTDRAAGYAEGATVWATKYQEVVKVLEDKLIAPDGDNIRASDAYFEIAKMVLGNQSGSVIEAVLHLQDDIHEQRNRAVHAERESQTNERNYQEVYRENENIREWKVKHDLLLEENDRLRKALREIRKSCPDKSGFANTCDKALAGKGGGE
jgi:hypothetical protein